MASSGSSDENFRARVEKIFGSLAFSRSPPPPPPSSSSSTSPSPASLWSLTDGDVEKREWRRDKSASYDRGETPCASSFDELLKQQRSSRTVRKQFKGDIDDLDENDDDGPERGEDDEFGEEWSIRSSIGLDRTLDNEEEEDEFDKVASGRENAGERLYMKDVTGMGCSLGSRDTLAKSSDKMIRDPRANHIAAKLRLKEDEAEAKKFSPSHNHRSGRSNPHSESSKDVVAPKPILKRKENGSDTRSSKRVRFDLGSGNNVEETTDTPEDISASPCSVDKSASEGTPHSGKSGNQIPDYLINPSRYTCYSFDSSSDVNEKSTTQEYMDLPKFVKGSKASDSESLESPSFDDLKVTFIPKKKTKNVSEDNNSSEIKEICEEREQETSNRAMPTTGIAAVEVAEDIELCTTEGEDPGIGESESCTSLRRPDRQYRAKRSSDEMDT